MATLQPRAAALAWRAGRSRWLSAAAAAAQDPWAVLGVRRGADEKEVREAYRREALKWHPDRHSGSSAADKAAAETRFKAASEAYNAIKSGGASASSGAGAWHQQQQQRPKPRRSASEEEARRRYEGPFGPSGGQPFTAQDAERIFREAFGRFESGEVWRELERQLREQQRRQQQGGFGPAHSRLAEEMLRNVFRGTAAGGFGAATEVQTHEYVRRDGVRVRVVQTTTRYADGRVERRVEEQELGREGHGRAAAPGGALAGPLGALVSYVRSTVASVAAYALLRLVTRILTAVVRRLLRL